MTQLAVERYFSVAAELTDGTKTTVRVVGETTAEAFQQVRQRPDVRRVGKVSEVSETAFHSDNPDPAPMPRQQQNPRRDFREERQVEAPQASVRRESLIGFTISGPRVVREVERSGVERPFRHLIAPPATEPVAVIQPEPAAPTYSPFGPFPPRPEPVVADAPVDVPEVQEDLTQTGTEYRIVKSRRKDGLPYLLQRGTWSQQSGKRVFKAEWEKDFSSREHAEQRLEWLQQMTKEAEELQTEE